MCTTNSMTNDERAIRDLVDKWLAASKAGDYETVLTLMADDVIFMVPGQEPFGKQQFAASATALQDMKIEASSEIQEIEIGGNWAWLRNRLSVTMTPPAGQPMRRSGFTLTILRKNSDGRWVIARDANLLMPEK
jgi:uncharacterized protein (TIGR02246 family)